MTTITIAAAVLTLAANERYAGLVLNADGTPSHHLILLPGQTEDVTWQAATEWATAQGGALPSRQEQALLYANAKGAFEAAWYWSGDEYEGNGAYAWYQDFSDGSQDYGHESYEGRARAVRRLTA